MSQKNPSAQDAESLAPSWEDPLFTNAPIGIICTDFEGQILSINPAMVRMLGYDSANDLLESVKGNARNLYADSSKREEFIRLLKENEEVIDYECWWVQRNDSLIWISINTSPVRDNNGNIIYLQNFITDLTERKQAREWLKPLFNNAPIGIYIIQKGKFKYCNSEFQEYSGYSREELLDTNALSLVHPEDRNMVRENAINMLKQERFSPYEYRIIDKAGQTKCILETVVSIRYQGSRASLGYFMDITVRKQMEERLKRLSLYDKLTGLYNRNFFETEKARLSNGRYSPIGIIVCDLDGLKSINDNFGHQVGDQMLVQTAIILRQNFRSSDIIARVGGDEFGVLITETDSGTIEQMLQRLRQAVEEYNNTGPSIPLSLSMGYAVHKGTAAEETVDIDALYNEADRQLYQDKFQNKRYTHSPVLEGLIATIEASDFETEGHCERLQQLVVLLGRLLDLSWETIEDLSLFARFHDLGKIGVSDHILFKPGLLTEEEWQQMRQHCEIGHRIASSVPALEPVADYILKHHERWDGKGYPLGLSGQDIPLPCRMLAIVDAFDAMTSKRPYKEPMSSREALQELTRCKGTQFDPDLVEKFVWILQEFQEDNYPPEFWTES